MIKWCVYDGLVDTQFRHAEWEGDNVEEILLDSTHSKDDRCKGFLEGMVYWIKSVVWVVCHSLGVCPLIFKRAGYT